jgi:uncharacterized protein DUF6600
MNGKKLINGKARVRMVMACVAVGWMCCSVGNTCHAQAPGNLAPGLQEVVKLSQAQMTDDVILSYIRNSGTPYSLSADDLLYLKSQNVSQNVIAALLQSQAATPAPNPTPPRALAPPQPPPSVASQPPPAPSEAPPSAAQGPEINYDYFHTQLAPYGTWVNVGGVMYWHPDAAIAANPDWRPYYDMGQWVHTEDGLFWQSEYNWGDIPFHYGRWVRDPGQGWLWAPDYTWGPAWVFWRHAEADASIGWAALPPGAVFVDGAFMFNGVAVRVDFDFGLGEDRFVFVAYDHFNEPFFRLRNREYAYHIDRERLHGFYGRSVIRNEFRKDEHGRFVNEGIGRDRVARLTKVENKNFEERHPAVREVAKTSGTGTTRGTGTATSAATGRGTGTTSSTPTARGTGTSSGTSTSRGTATTSSITTARGGGTTSGAATASNTGTTQVSKVFRPPPSTAPAPAPAPKPAPAPARPAAPPKK